MLKQPIGKSGVNHRMRRLMRLIETDQRQNGDQENDHTDVGFIQDYAPEPDAD